MSADVENSSKFQELRRRAEELLAQRLDALGAARRPSPGHDPDILELIAELDVHQAELEIQNEELQDANERLDLLFREYSDLYDHAPCGYLTLDRKALISKINQAGCRLLGMECKQNASGPLSLFLAPAFHGAYFTALRQTGDSGVPQYVELQLAESDAPSSWVLAHIMVDRNASGAVEQWRLSLTDITQLKAVEEDLRDAKAEAEGANRAKSQFLANMSHEIRTPINGVMGMFQLLQMTALDKEQAEYAETGITSCTRLSGLIGDILDLTKVEVGSLEISKCPFNIVELMEGVAYLFQPAAKLKGLDIQLHVDPAMPGWVVGDSARLQQILNNLMGNALKFTEAGTVSLEASYILSRWHDRKMAFFTVADTGMGIPDDQLDFLFEPFAQGSIGYSRKFQGAGLGLAITRKLVALMGGNMCVSSEEGVGTTFHVCLPFEQVEQPQEDVPLNVFEASPRKGLKVLLAEDEESSRQVMAKLLEKKGHEVVVAQDGQQALETLQGEDFDCIFMDIQMPVLDGMQATKIIRADPKFEAKARIPIIAVTAYAMAGDREKSLGAGMTDYLAKPVEVRALVRILDRVANGSY